LRIEQLQSGEKPDGAQKKPLSTENEKAIRSEVRQLYLELISLKDDSPFHKVGFAPRYKYSKWLDRVGKLYEDSRYKDFLKKKGLPASHSRKGVVILIRVSWN
jgi:hypothetical protein